jgi:MFS family permease
MILMVALNASAGLSSQIIGRVKHYKLVPAVCLVIGIAAVFALAFSTSQMTSLKFEIILLLIGVGFGPTSPLAQVALQNTVANHHLGSAIGTMNFARTLCGTILVAVLGAIVLAGVPVDGSAATLSQHVLVGTSVAAFSAVFFITAGTLSIALLALILLEEKPLLATLPEARP